MHGSQHTKQQPLKSLKQPNRPELHLLCWMLAILAALKNGLTNVLGANTIPIKRFRLLSGSLCGAEACAPGSSESKSLR